MNFLPLPTNLFPYWFFPWNTHSWTFFTPFIYHKELLAVDSILQLFPWREFVTGQLLQGKFPLWNPYSFSGQPLLANLQSSTFYPLTWFFLLFPPVSAWSIYLLTQPFLATIFMFLFLRGRGLAKLSSLFGACALIFSGFFASRYFWGIYLHPLIWLPLALFLIDKFSAGRVRAGHFVIFLSLLFTLMILGGYPQHSLFSLILTAGYFLVRIPLRRAHLLAASLLLSLLLSGIQLLPTIELYRNSVRDQASGAQFFGRGMSDARQLVTAVVPDYFGSPATNNYSGGQDYTGVNHYFGLIPLIFALFALKKRGLSGGNRFWLGVLLAGLLFAHRTPLSFLPNLLRLPILSSGAPWNDLFLFQFGGAVLGATGFDLWQKKPDRSILPVAFAVLLLVGLLLLAGRSDPVAFRNSGYILILVTATAILVTIQSRLSAVLIFLLSVVAGFLYLQKMSPWGEQRYFYPSHPAIDFLKKNAGYDRFWGPSGATLAPDFSVHYRLYDPQGYDSLWPKWYGQLIAGADGGKMPLEIDRALVRLPEKDSPFRRKLLNLLSVRYLLDKSDKPEGDRGQNILKYPLSRYTLLKQWADVSVYENKEALPRAFLVGKYTYAPAPGALQEFYADTFNPAAEIILADNPSRTFDYATGSARITRYEPDTVEIEAVSSGSALLFLSDTYFPGWQATVNGRSEKIYPADFAFRAVAVPDGYSRVKFVFRPVSFRLGSILTLFGILLLITTAVLSRRRFSLP